MAKRKTVEITCDRCNRTEYIPDPGASNDGAKALAEFDASFQHPKDGYVVIKYGDLCSRCRRVIERNIDRIRHLDLKAEEKEDSK